MNLIEDGLMQRQELWNMNFIRVSNGYYPYIGMNGQLREAPKTIEPLKLDQLKADFFAHAVRFSSNCQFLL